MDSFQRVINCFTGDKIDKVPIFHIGFSSQVASKILGREAFIGGGIQQWREATAVWQGEEAHKEFLEHSYQDAFEMAEICNMDIVRPSYWRMPQKPKKRISEYEFLYGDDYNWNVRKFDVKTELYEIIDSNPPRNDTTFEDIEKSLEKQTIDLTSYDPSISSFEAVKAALKYFEGKKVIRVDAGHVDIPMDAIWLEAIYLRPDLVKKHLQLQVEKAIIDIKYLSNLGIKFVFGGGDLASNSGPIYSPNTFHEFVFPAVKKIVEECHSYNIYYLFNSDGNLWPIGEDLFGISGVDGYYEIDRKAGMDLEKLRIMYSNLTLVGANISSYTLHRGSREEVKNETFSCIEAAKKYGKIIVGCSNYLVPGTPIENFWTMVETLAKYC